MKRLKSAGMVIGESCRVVPIALSSFSKYLHQLEFEFPVIVNFPLLAIRG